MYKKCQGKLMIIKTCQKCLPCIAVLIDIDERRTNNNKNNCNYDTCSTLKLMYIKLSTKKRFLIFIGKTATNATFVKLTPGAKL